MPRTTFAERLKERQPLYMESDGSLNYQSAQAWAEAAYGTIIDECDQARLYQFRDGSMIQIGPAGMFLYDAR